MKKTILALMLAFLALTGCASETTDKEEQSSPGSQSVSSESEQEVLDQEEAVEMNYLDLYENYKSYNGTLVQISGKVNSKGTNILKTSYFTIKDGIEGLTGEIYLNLKNGEDVDKYNEGDFVTVVGTVGTKTAGTLNIDDVIVVATGDESKAKTESAIMDNAESSVALTITAADLLKAYDENAIRADELYKDKVIEVTGVVDSIDKDIANRPYITLTNGEQFQLVSVQCYLKKESEIQKAANINKGDTISVIGTCDGGVLNIILKDCTLK